MCEGDGPCDELLRFRAKTVTVPGMCTFWVGAIAIDGYGRFHTSQPGTGTVTAHRWLYEHVHGPLPPEDLVMHACDETSCVTLDDLVIGDHYENMADMRRRGRQAGARHTGRSDTRGPAGRARAIRDVLLAGGDAADVAAAAAAGDPWRDQLELFDSTLAAAPVVP